jgi:cellulose synthase/poly-beta-1,6-N-acetylglucosamine synthase-like glycosyltransferase
VSPASVLEALGLLLGAAVAVPAATLLLQVLFAGPARRPASPVPARRPRIAVLVPAHDEAAVLARTLASVRAQLVPGDRLLVVADNCTDDTAALALEAGAEATVRVDEARRGKAYAVEHGIRHLAGDPPDVVIVIDADCEAEPGAIARLADCALRTGRPVQAIYLMRAAHDGLVARLREFAWTVKNRVRPLGAARLGMPCQLAGAGMAFPWRAAAGTTYANADLAEDFAAGVRFARAGTPPLLCAEAIVASAFPAGAAGLASQQRRWEHGHLALVLREAPRLFATGLVRRDASLLAMALDLAVPPLALLTLAVLVLLALGVALAFAVHRWLPLALGGGAAAMLGTAILLAWWRFGRATLSLRDLAYAPVYALRKLPLYLAFAFNRQVGWVKTARDPAGAPRSASLGES